MERPRYEPQPEQSDLEIKWRQDFGDTDMPDGAYFDEELGIWMVPDIGNLSIQTC